MLQVEGTTVASHNDLVYLAPAREGWEGLPLGNGRFGAQVWQPDGLMFQFNTPFSGAYGGAIARLLFGTALSMLGEMKSYTQRLSLGTATLITHLSGERGEVTLRCYVPADADALAYIGKMGRCRQPALQIRRLRHRNNERSRRTLAVCPGDMNGRECPLRPPDQAADAAHVLKPEFNAELFQAEKPVPGIAVVGHHYNIPTGIICCRIIYSS